MVFKNYYKILELETNKITMSEQTYYFMKYLERFLLENDPMFFGSLGMVASVGISVVGAAWGIMLVGSSLMGSSIKTSFKSKHLISILFCEAVAIYGVIAGFIFTVC